jgi:undecaprenyl-diphosphatase
MLFGGPSSLLVQDHLVVKILVGFLPILIMGYLTKSLKRDSVSLIAWTTFVGGFVIMAIETFRPKVRVDHLGKLTWFHVLAVGLGQCLSLCPGVSRSGATIMTGMVIGMSRSVATEFTFLLAIPTMTAASGYQFLKHRHEFDQTMMELLVLGFVFSFISAFFVVKWLIRFIQTHSFMGFAWYRIAVGGLLLYFISRGVI